MVYDACKYRIEGRIINTETGKELPSNIPLFLLLATDIHTPHAIFGYFQQCMNERHTAEGFEVAQKFINWQKENEQLIHEPDGRE